MAVALFCVPACWQPWRRWLPLSSPPCCGSELKDAPRVALPCPAPRRVEGTRDRFRKQRPLSGELLPETEESNQLRFVLKVWRTSHGWDTMRSSDQPLVNRSNAPPPKMYFCRKIVLLFPWNVCTASWKKTATQKISHQSGLWQKENVFFLLFVLFFLEKRPFDLFLKTYFKIGQFWYLQSKNQGINPYPINFRETDFLLGCYYWPDVHLWRKTWTHVTNLMRIKWKVSWAHGTQPNTF